MKRFLLFALVATMFAACATDATEDVAVNIETPETLTVSFEGDSRIQLQNGKTVWTKGDLVSVFYKSYDNLQFRFDGETGDRNGTLSKVSGTIGMQTMDHTIVAYPYSSDYRISLSTGGLDAVLPATQCYTKDSYGVGYNLMVGQSEFTQFSLKNVCGWLKVQLKGEGQVVKSITLKGNNNEQVAGLVHINTADATLTLASTPANEGDSNSVAGNLVLENSTSTTVTLDCGEGVTLGSEATVFYIALPPQTFEKGLTIEIEAIDGSKMTKSTENAIVIERNTIQPMATLEIDFKEQIPNNEIWYTSSDGNIVTPYDSYAFGANILSNTYKNGRGVIKFDSDVTSIEKWAFRKCTSLTSVTIPDSVTSIGEYAFGSCDSLTSITIPDSVTEIGKQAFHSCISLTSVIIGNRVASIGDDAFLSCKSLTSVYISDLSAWCKIPFGEPTSNPLYKGAKLYLNGVEVTDITIPSDIAEIKDYTFYKCTSLTSIAVPDSVTSIGTYAFCGCTSLTSVTIRVASIGEGAFYECTSLTSVTIGNRVISIGDYAFYGCTSLTSATIGNRVTSIGAGAFSSCSSLTSITIPDSVTSIGESAFSDCTSLTSVTIPDSVTSIEDYAFQNCTSLTSITIPDSVAEIMSYVFHGCTSLTSVYYKGDLFEWCKVYFASPSSNPLYYGAKLYLNGVEVTDITIPSNITEIKRYTFSGYTLLTSITIPESVTSIGYGAFYKCTSLISVTISDSVTSIGGSAFGSCTSLKEVYCKPITPPTGSTYMFDKNASGRKIYVPTASVEAYESASRWRDYASDIVGYDF